MQQSSAVKMQRYPQFGAFRDIPPKDILQVAEKKPPIFVDKPLQRDYRYTVQCSECSNDFVPRMPTQRFCSEKCGNRARYKRYKTRVKKGLKLLAKNGKLQTRTA